MCAQVCYHRRRKSACAPFDLLLGDNLQGRKDHIAENGYKYLELADIS